ncbi:MAG: AAA family ATPase [Promethearchaeota archaeon]
MNVMNMMESQLIFRLGEDAKERKPEIILMVGASGSGKTHYIKKNNMEAFYEVISADKIRYDLYDFAKGIQLERESEVWAIFYKKLEKLLKQKIDIIVDNTNTTYYLRYPIVCRALRHGYRIGMIFMKAALERCLYFNLQRKGHITPEDIVKEQVEKLQLPETWEYDTLEIYNNVDMEGIVK